MSFIFFTRGSYETEMILDVDYNNNLEASLWSVSFISLSCLALPLIIIVLLDTMKFLYIVNNNLSMGVGNKGARVCLTLNCSPKCWAVCSNYPKGQFKLVFLPQRLCAYENWHIKPSLLEKFKRDDLLEAHSYILSIPKHKVSLSRIRLGKWNVIREQVSFFLSLWLTDFAWDREPTTEGYNHGIME
jgi:hypothetical protein